MTGTHITLAQMKALYICVIDLSYLSQVSLQTLFCYDKISDACNVEKMRSSSQETRRCDPNELVASLLFLGR